MFNFAWPWALILLPLPLLVAWLWPKPSAPDMLEQVLRFPNIRALAHAYEQKSKPLVLHKTLHQRLLVLLWVFGVLCLMQPQRLDKHTQVSSRGYDLMLAVDVSRSMLALDFTEGERAVNRMAVVKAVVGAFIQQRQKDRVGLILFGEVAYVQSPLTQDSAVVQRMLRQAEPTMAGDGTAIGDAIGLAVKKLKERPEGSRILLLLTDGENTAGRLQPSDAMRLAKQFGVRIYTIGVGSLGDAQGEVDFPEDGRIIKQKMRIDEALLQAIAEQTGGSYFRATDTQALAAIYQQINRLEKTEIQRHSVWVPQPLYRWPLAGVMGIMLLLVGLSLRRGGQW